MEDEDVGDFKLEVDDNSEVGDKHGFCLINSMKGWKREGFEDVARAFLERYEQKHTYVSLFKMQQLPGESAEQCDTRFLKQAWTNNWREHGLSGSIKNYVNIKEPQSVEQVHRYAVLAEKNCTSTFILMFFYHVL